MSLRTRFVASSLLVLLVACGGSNNSVGGDANGCELSGCTHDASSGGDSNTGGDGSTGGDGGTTGGDGGTTGSDGGTTGSDGGTTGTDGGTTGSDGGVISDAGMMGDGGTTSPCAVPQNPTQTYALSGSAAFGDSRWPRMAYAGGSIFAIGPFSGDTGWYKWAGGGWSFITPPWPTGPKPYIIDTYDLPTGHILFQVQLTHAPNDYDYALIDFDGTTMSAPVIIPPALRGFVREATRTPDGQYHILTSSVPNEPPWTLRSYVNGAWTAASPVPIPSQVDWRHVAFTALTNGRMVLLYSNGHLHELHRRVNEQWSTDVDLTPSWAVAAADPVAVGARSGGISIAVTGVSNSYRFPYYWDSPDGVTYSAGEYTNPATQLQDQTKFLAADCIAQPVLVIRRQNSIMLLKRGAPADWQPLATGASYYSAGGSAAILPNGKTFFGWSYTLSNGDKFTTLLATP